MWPFSYSRWATCIAYLAEKPSLRDASCWSVVVRNGAYGDLRYGFRSTEPTVKPVSPSRPARAAACSPSRCSRSADFSCPVGPKSRPCATRLPSTATSEAVNGDMSAPRTGANSASRSQYREPRKAIRSRSLSTTSRTATDCTRPADSRGMTFFHSTGETSYP